jgi:hypothetical protein
MNYFVYVNEAMHVWRFVHFSPDAPDGDAAIDEAVAEARAMGAEPNGSYMATPFDAVTTRLVGAPRFAARHPGS